MDSIVLVLEPKKKYTLLKRMVRSGPKRETRRKMLGPKQRRELSGKR